MDGQDPRVPPKLQDSTYGTLHLCRLIHMQACIPHSIDLDRFLFFSSHFYITHRLSQSIFESPLLSLNIIPSIVKAHGNGLMKLLHYHIPRA